MLKQLLLAAYKNTLVIFSVGSNTQKLVFK